MSKVPPVIRETVLGLAHGVLWTIRHRRDRYDVPPFRIARSFIPPGDVAVDVGAHAGSWMVKLGKHAAGPDSVFAYEALPRYGVGLRVLKFSLALKTVRLRPVALGSKAGSADLVYAGTSGRLTGMTHIAAPGEIGRSVTVPMTTLDSDLLPLLNGRRVAFMKIDVEGLELEVLKGSEAILSTFQPALYIEADPRWTARYGHDVEADFSYLEALGYKAWIQENERLVPTSPAEYLAQESIRDVFFLGADG